MKLQQYWDLHFTPSDGLKRRLELYRAAAEWNKYVDPVQLVENGKEPQIDLKVPFQIPH